jgi:hypothetical protein
LVSWRSYNESLVRREEVVLDFAVIDNWNNELDNNNDNNMNNGKEGTSYRLGTPILLFNYLVIIYEFIFFTFHTDRQKTEGVVKAHSNKKVPSVPDSTGQ